MLSPRDATAEERSLCGLNYQVAMPEEVIDSTPFVLLAHGRSGNRKVMWSFARCVRALKAVVISAEAPFEDPAGGFCWWPHTTGTDAPVPTRTPFEEITSSSLTLERFVEAASRLYFDSPLRQVIAIGFSQGGALVLSASLRSRIRFTAVASLSAFLPKAIAVPYDQGIVSLEGPLPPCFFYHGSQDSIVSPHAAELARNFFSKRGAQTRLLIDDTAHKVSLAGMKELERWLLELG